MVSECRSNVLERKEVETSHFFLEWPPESMHTFVYTTLQEITRFL